MCVLMNSSGVTPIRSISFFKSCSTRPDVITTHFNR
jgi:hypothetical protein